MRHLITVDVPGRPRTKGSLKGGRTPDGRDRMVDTPLSKQWRATVADAVKPLIADIEKVERGKTWWRLRPGWPIAGAVKVEVTFFFERTGVAELPTGRNFGDIDKLLRNVLDALKDAGLYTDDSLVMDVRGAKYFGAQEGAWISAWEM